MCGIVGFIGQDNLDESNIKNGLNEIKSRGPDSVNFVKFKNGIFGHARLSIIDISDSASQPFYSSCGRYLIVFNGEIYNYKELKLELGNIQFRSSSDTEVLLECYIKWGVAAFNKFHGMFAFVIWDSLEEKMILVRDRMGVKPLYYHQNDSGIVFASRPKALCSMMPSLPKHINKQALRYYLEAGYVPAPFSIYDQINKLQPGHYICIDDQETVSCKYWDFADIEVNSDLLARDENELLDELDDLVDKSIRWRMESDVPIGAFLSGGIDSSLVTALMSKYSKEPVKTFTIGFGDSRYDESQHAEAVSKHLDTVHYHKQLSPKDLLELMPEFLSNFDEPFYDYSAFPVMAVSKFAREHVKVALSGDGGDEVFGGYHYYELANKIEYFFKLPDVIRRLLARVLRKVPKHNIRLLGEALMLEDGIAAFSFMRSVIKANKNIMLPEFQASTSPLSDLFSKRAKDFPPEISAAERGMRIDLSYTLPDDYLQKVDLASMAFSLEAREPLLDHSIIKWGVSLPLTYKIRGKENKYLLRKLAYKYIPRSILDRPKQGFRVPLTDWLRVELKEWAGDLLKDDQSITELGLNSQVINKLWSQHLSGERDNHTTLWTIIVLLQFKKGMKE